MLGFKNMGRARHAVPLRGNRLIHAVGCIAPKYF